VDRITLILAAIVLVWGGNNAAMRWLALTTPVFCIVWTRGLLAGAPLLGWVWHTEGALRLGRGDRAAFLLAGFLGLAAFQILFTWGLRWTTAAHAALLLALSLLFAALWERILDGAQVHKRFLVGGAVALVGVAVVVGLDALRFRDARQVAGDLLALAGAVAWSFYAVYQKRLLLRGHSPAKVTALASLCSAAAATPFALWEILNADWSRVGWAQAGVQLYSAWLATLLAQVAWSYSIKHRPARVVMLFQSIVPVSTALAAWLLLGEPITWSLLWGGLLIMAGVSYARRG
jgi:drug/metabolite transporter (DMT)-like permease